MSIYSNPFRYPVVPLFLVAAGAALLSAGCKNNQQVSKAPVNIGHTAPPEPHSAESETPTLRSAITEMLEKDAHGDHAFPDSVQLKSVEIAHGVAVVDFSHEFAKLADSGETVESEAQKRLRSTVAKFKNVERMRVTVEGRPFESQATDWNVPFAVRDKSSKPKSSDLSSKSEGASE